jgi:hypothetical protein
MSRLQLVATFRHFCLYLPNSAQIWRCGHNWGSLLRDGHRPAEYRARAILLQHSLGEPLPKAHLRYLRRDARLPCLPKAHEHWIRWMALPSSSQKGQLCRLPLWHLPASLWLQ